jgi:hypothetical protein
VHTQEAGNTHRWRANGVPYTSNEPRESLQQKANYSVGCKKKGGSCIFLGHASKLGKVKQGRVIMMVQWAYIYRKV